MKIAFPVDSGSGLDSEIFEHFGSASRFIIIDSETGAFEEVDNNDLGHSHNKCNPMKALGGRTVDAVITGGIGHGALNGLRSLGVKVFRSVGGSVSKNMELFGAGFLQEFTPGFVCGGHGEAGGCAHHH